MKKAFLILCALCLSAGAYAQTQTIRAFSHRGGRLERDENTAGAFQDSWDAGYTGFETDIHGLVEEKDEDGGPARFYADCVRRDAVPAAAAA